MKNGLRKALSPPRSNKPTSVPSSDDQVRTNCDPENTTPSLHPRHIESFFQSSSQAFTKPGVVCPVKSCFKSLCNGDCSGEEDWFMQLQKRTRTLSCTTGDCDLLFSSESKLQQVSGAKHATVQNDILYSLTLCCLIL